VVVLRMTVSPEEMFVGVITIGVLLQPPSGTLTLRVEKSRFPTGADTVLTVILPLV
jgi:hypothetical protein